MIPFHHNSRLERCFGEESTSMILMQTSQMSPYTLYRVPSEMLRLEHGTMVVRSLSDSKTGRRIPNICRDSTHEDEDRREERDPRAARLQEALKSEKFASTSRYPDLDARCPRP